jgi:acetyltransferase-like isoleucine patch superfamily enzyme
MINFVKRLFRLILSPLKIFINTAITHWPDNNIGNKLRVLLWRYGLNNFGKNSKVCSGSKFFFGKKIHIGDNLSMSNNVTLDPGDSHGIYIGDHVSIADGTYFRSANHKFDSTEKLIQEQGHECAEIDFLDRKYSIVVEDDVWLGARVIIISGSHIGKGSIVSAGAVISNIIPPYSIVVGNPGRVIKNRKK